MIDCQTFDRWDEIYGDAAYIEVSINDKEAVCVKCIWEDDDNYFSYVMDCENGMEVYLQGLGSEYGVRNLTDEERQAVLDWIKEQFDVEREMDAYGGSQWPLLRPQVATERSEWPGLLSFEYCYLL